MTGEESGMTGEEAGMTERENQALCKSNILILFRINSANKILVM